MKFRLYATGSITFIALSIVSFVFAIYGYPLLSGDSGCFLPAAYFLNHGHQLINAFYDAGIDTATHKFIFYPPLFPYVTALISRLLPIHPNQIFVALTVLNTLSIAIILCSIYFYIRDKKIDVDNLSYLFCIVLTLSVFAFLDVSSGRPEILSQFLISCFILNNVVPKNKFTDFINGTIIGLNVLNSLISSFYLVVINLYVLTYKRDLNIKQILTTIAGFCMVCLIFVIVYPYPISMLVQGISRHSKNVFFSKTGIDYIKMFIERHLTVASTPLPIIPFIISFIYATYKTIINKRYLALGSIILLALIMVYFATKDMRMSYNFYVLSPIVSFIIAGFYFNQAHKSPGTMVLQLILIGTLFINSIGFIRKILILYKSQDKFVTAAVFRNTLINTINHTAPGKKILVTCSLWPYCQDKSNQTTLYRFFFDHTDPILKDSTYQYLIVQQNYTGLTQPNNYEGFKLVTNQFIKDKIMLGRFTLANTYPGYQVAIYERK